MELFEAFENKGVGAVNDGGVEAGEVDLSGCFTVVTHAFRDYRKGDALCFGGGGPAVAGDVEGQRNLDSYHLGYLFQVVIDVVAHVAVGASLVGAGILDDRKQVIGCVLWILVEYHLHFLCPFDNQLLTGLTTAIGDVSVFEVRFFEKCHVDETHSTEVETHQEHIASIVKRGIEGQVQCFDFLDDRQRQGSFNRLVNSGIDVLEWIAVFYDVIFDGTVIDRTEYAGVKRDSVWGYTSTFMPCLVSLHYPRGEAVKHYVLILSELFETVERRLVGLGSSDLAVLFEFYDDTLHKVE